MGNRTSIEIRKGTSGKTGPQSSYSSPTLSVRPSFVLSIDPGVNKSSIFLEWQALFNFFHRPLPFKSYWSSHFSSSLISPAQKYISIKERKLWKSVPLEHGTHGPGQGTKSGTPVVPGNGNFVISVNGFGRRKKSAQREQKFSPDFLF